MVIESHHFLNNIFVNGWEQSTGNELHVNYRKGIHKDLKNPNTTQYQCFCLENDYTTMLCSTST